LSVEFRQGDAAALPFPDAGFDVAICECTLCLLDKSAVLQEMARVVRPGGRVAMHDLFWEENAPDKLKEALIEIEEEEPETLKEWQRLFTGAGLINIRVVDKSEVKARWMRDNRRQLGISGQLRLGLYVFRRWWFSGLWAILRSERIFSSAHLGYCIVVGERPGSGD
jgi:ubiquinone/menaquinone biosynthesis C-methylase UbiE